MPLGRILNKLPGGLARLAGESLWRPRRVGTSPRPLNKRRSRYFKARLWNVLALLRLPCIQQQECPVKKFIIAAATLVMMSGSAFAQGQVNPQGNSKPGTEQSGMQNGSMSSGMQNGAMGKGMSKHGMKKHAKKGGTKKSGTTM